MKNMEVVQWEMMTDYLLHSMLSDLSDSERTTKSIQSILEFVVINPTVAKLLSSFVTVIRESNSQNHKFTPFEKRVLLFLIVHCATLGQNLEYSFANDTYPLELMLERLNDIYLAFENSDLIEYILDVWIQTVKHAVFSFLRHGRTVRASQVLVVYRSRVIKEHQDILKNFIDICSLKPSLASEALESEGHDYPTYYSFVADLAEELNKCLEEPTLLTLAQQINTTMRENIPAPDSPEIAQNIDIEAVDTASKASEHSENYSDETFADIDAQVPVPDLISTEVGHPHNDEKNSESEVSSATNISDNEEIVVRQSQGMRRKRSFVPSDSDSECSVSKHVNPIPPVKDGRADAPEEIEQPEIPQQISQREEAKQDDNESYDSDRPTTSKNISDAIRSPNPRHSLSYRLREQTDLGILIPCKNIISLCRKVHNEEKQERTPHKVDPERCRTSTPIRSTHSAFRSSLSPTNLLLGDRFEVAAAQSTVSNRSYASSKRYRNIFTLDHDSYIIAGCKYLGVGHWSNIISIFPFPPTFTNMTIKDRYRTLLKRKTIDNKNGEIQILDIMLKNKMPTAEKLLEENLIKEREAHEESRVEAEETTARPQKRGSETLSVMSMSSKSDEVQSENEGPKFTTIEDAFLICGMRNFGYRWVQIRENFNFKPSFTSQDLSSRWRYLSKHKMVTLNEDGELCCRNMKLKEECQKAERELKRRIRIQRKKFDVNTNPGESETTEREVYEVELDVQRQIPDRRPTPPPTETAFGKKQHQEVEKSSSSNAKQNDQELRAGSSGDGHSRSPILQQKRRKLANNSPSMFGETSDSHSNSDGGKSLPVGTSIRPSKLNTFKTFSVKNFGTTKRKKHKVSSSKQDIRLRRQKRLSREQRIPPGRKNPWTKQEINELLAGLTKHGPGNWAIILDDGWDVFRDRTSVMIKDKFRNMKKNNELPEDLILQWDAMKAARE